MIEWHWMNEWMSEWMNEWMNNNDKFFSMLHTRVHIVVVKLTCTSYDDNFAF